MLVALDSVFAEASQKSAHDVAGRAFVIKSRVCFFVSFDADSAVRVRS